MTGLRRVVKAIPGVALFCAAMGFSGVGMAAGTTLPGLFSIDHNLVVGGGGVVTADCPVGSTCQDLPGTGDGLLLRSVKTAAGVDFIQSIIAEDLAGGGLFANEQDVRQGVQGVQNGANIAQKMVIDDPLNGFNATHTTVTDGFFTSGTQNLNGLPIFQLNQTVDLDNGAFSKVRIRGAISQSLGPATHGVEDIATNPYFGPGAREQLGGLKVYIDQIGGVNEPEMGDFVYRYDRTRFSVENQLLDNTLGSVSTGVVFPGSFQTTRDAVVYMHQSVDDGYGTDFGLLKYGAGVYTYNPPTHTGSWAPVWTPTLVALDGLPTFSTSTVQTGLDATDAYGTWGTGSVASAIFGELNDYSDLNVQTFLP